MLVAQSKINSSFSDLSKSRSSSCLVAFQEACARACPHGACKQRCGEACARAACPLPCARALRCGHQCRGLCGERCPDVCKLCRPDQFPVDFLGDQFDDDALFVLLEDCGHVMEFETLEDLMKVQSDEVKMQSCPNCRAPIINTPRYKDLVNRKLAEDINPIKERVYGNEARITARRKELHETVADFHNIHNGIYTDKLFLHWKKAFEQIILVVKSKKKKYSLPQLDMYFVYLSILELLSDVHKKYTSVRLTELQENVIDLNKIICQVLAKNVHKLSEQQQADIGNEIKRMNAIVHLAEIISHPSYIASKSVPNVTETANSAKTIILKWGIYEHDKATEALNEFQKAVKVSGIVTRAERELIIKAIGAKAGQWYKCPNGHFYSINRCGGATVVSKCVECKADIGGTNHRLLSSNRHAGEFDNSRFAAYSEEANNLGNFDLDNLF